MMPAVKISCTASGSSAESALSVRTPFVSRDSAGATTGEATDSGGKSCVGRNSATVFSNRSMLIGFVRNPLQPAAAQRCRSCSITLAVNARIGLVKPASLKVRVAAKPSITGICISISSSSYSPLLAFSTAIAPFSASSTISPAFRRTSPASCRFAAVSSVIRIRAGLNQIFRPSCFCFAAAWNFSAACCSSSIATPASSPASMQK